MRIELTSTYQEANWYKPEAGQPYRPRIAIPSQLKQKIPWFSFCTDIFTAFDPPQPLQPAKSLVPGPTSTGHATSQPLTPAPSVTLDTGASKTTNGAGSMPSLTNAKASSDFKQASGINKDSGQSSDSQQSSSTSEGPGQKTSSSIHSLPPSTTAVSSNQDSSTIPVSTAIAMAATTMKQAVSSNQDSSPIPVSTTIAIPATTMTQGDSGTTLRGTLVAPDTSGRSLVDSKTMPMPTGMDSDSFNTTNGGWVVTNTSTAITIAGTTLGPGNASPSVERHCDLTRRGISW